MVRCRSGICTTSIFAMSHDIVHDHGSGRALCATVHVGKGLGCSLACIYQEAMFGQFVTAESVLVSFSCQADTVCIIGNV